MTWVFHNTKVENYGENNVTGPRSEDSILMKCLQALISWMDWTEKNSTFAWISTIFKVHSYSL